ncbi:AAA family ATPase [Desulfatibacillum aliphaticivorans]|uniref:AAA family ATPase n=1 Tax=Desulfatibacillum aliphaticivorans TaxID=218208 RepID=UPI0003F52A27|nr:AAA family ATPase [Desulfatibacillum aliphaticivorans]
MTTNISAEKLCLSDGRFGLGGYIALSQERQEDLLGLSDMIRAYIKNENAPRPMNILLEAHPGAGKSYLVKELCQLVKKTVEPKQVDFLTFNLTAMESFRDLAPCFRKIQNCHLTKTFPVVLFDEVDTQFPQNRHSYSSFLAPMYDGKVYEGGESFNIGRAVFFFAASKALLSKSTWESLSCESAKDGCPKEPDPNQDEKSPPHKDSSSNLVQDGRPQESSQLNDESYPQWIKNRMDEMRDVIEHLRNPGSKPPDKFLDFLDRMDRIVFLPPLKIMPEKNVISSQYVNGTTDNAGTKNEPDEPLWLTELYLIIISMIFQRFPNDLVTYVEEKVLTILTSALMESPSRRKPDSFVRNSYPPVDGIFRVENLPPHCRDELRDIFEKIETMEENGDLKNDLIPVKKNRYGAEDD